MLRGKLVDKTNNTHNLNAKAKKYKDAYQKLSLKYTKLTEKDKKVIAAYKAVRLYQIKMEQYEKMHEQLDKIDLS